MDFQVDFEMPDAAGLEIYEDRLAALDAAIEAYMTDASYTAYSLIPGGPEEIEVYPTLEDAVGDVLSMWPEDPEHDVAVLGGPDRGVVFMRHVHYDSEVCEVRYPDRIERYRCRYVIGREAGRVEALVERLF